MGFKVLYGSKRTRNQIDAYNPITSLIRNPPLHSATLSLTIACLWIRSSIHRVRGCDCLRGYCPTTQVITPFHPLAPHQSASQRSTSRGKPNSARRVRERGFSSMPGGKDPALICLNAIAHLRRRLRRALNAPSPLQLFFEVTAKNSAAS